MTTSLVKFEAVKQALAEARRIDEVKEVRDKAEALRLYVKQQGDGLEMQNDIAEIKLRAERRAGELLAERDKAKGHKFQPILNPGGSTMEPPALGDLGITKQQSHRWQLEAGISEELFEQHVAEVKAAKEELTSAGLLRLAKGQSVHFSSNTAEWLTPPEIIDRVLRVLGEIDLDPCSNSRENPNVPATEHYTREHDGLDQGWYGRVYMNPPYGQEIADWAKYLCSQFENRDVNEAIALLPARTDTEWFRRLCQYPRCFIWGRLRFSDNETGAPFPSMVVYLGKNVAKFIEVFSDIGDIYVLWSKAGEGTV